MTSNVLGVACLICCVVVPNTIGAQSLTPVQIAAAIAQGQKDKKSSSSVRILRPDAAARIYAVQLDGPFARIVMAAAQAAQKYLPFTPADVTDEMKGDTLLITAYPPTPTFSFGSWSIAPAATHMVLQAKDRQGDALQPETIEPFPVAWSNALGGQFEGQGLSATFPLDKVPAGPFDVVLMLGSIEQRYSVKDKPRALIH